MQMADPVIKCLPRDGQPLMMRFWCPFCRKWHYHGEGNGQRTAHCTNPNSPYSRTGYEIRMMTKAELRDIRKAIDLHLEVTAP